MVQNRIRKYQCSCFERVTIYDLAEHVEVVGVLKQNDHRQKIHVLSISYECFLVRRKATVKKKKKKDAPPN